RLASQAQAIAHTDATDSTARRGLQTRAESNSKDGSKDGSRDGAENNADARTDLAGRRKNDHNHCNVEAKTASTATSGYQTSDSDGPETEPQVRRQDVNPDALPDTRPDTRQTSRRHICQDIWKYIRQDI